MVLMPGFQSTRLVTEGALEPFFFLYTDDSIQGNPETCKQSSVMLNYEVKNMVEQGLDMKVVQYIMGHANIRVTMEAYNHIPDPERARIKNEIAKIDAVQVVRK